MTRRFERWTAARAFWVVAAVLVSSACATKSDIRDIQSELRSLAMRQDSLLAQLRLDALSTQDTLRTQSDQIFDFRGQITRELREISQGLATLQAIAGENQRGIAGVRDQLANLRRSPVQSTGPSTGDTTGVSDEGVGGVGGNPQQLWEVATGQLSRGSLNAAQRAFEEFLQDFPNHELAPDGHFFLADILAQQDRTEDALEAFQAVHELFPTAAKVPDALYRIALLQVELERTDEAIETLERIMNTYPDSAIALIARDKLAELR